MTSQDILVAVHVCMGDERAPLTVEYRTDIADTLEFVACVYDSLDGEGD
jgi:hypothetical protein